MTMWVFGDSFTDGFNHEGSWIAKLSQKYNQPVRSLAIPGSSISYTINIFEQRIKDFTNDEIIIIGLTSANRTYFLKDYPHISQPHQFDKDWIDINGLSEDIKLAIELHTKFFTDVIYESNISLVTSFLYRLNHLSAGRKHKIIVLPCFEDVRKTIEKHRDELINLLLPYGCLFDISTCEFESANYDKIFNQLISQCDPRSGHMTYTNHEIFYDKLYLSMNRTIPLDFTHGFAKELITLESLKDPEFINKEFHDFHGHYKK